MTSAKIKKSFKALKDVANPKGIQILETDLPPEITPDLVPSILSNLNILHSHQIDRI